MFWFGELVRKSLPFGDEALHVLDPVSLIGKVREHEGLQKLLLEHAEIGVLVDQLRYLPIGLRQSWIAFLIAELA